MKHLRHLSLGTRLSAIAFVLIAIVFGIFIIATGYSTSNTLEKQALNDLTEKSQSVTDMIDLFNAD
ncbi:MAG: hypothetical protein VB032_08875, partial [Burkholderiaceae bacterium]|nr:hypothetical protein [Burkholderiaceae bacterium]